MTQATHHPMHRPMHQLLPPQSTPLERAIVDSAPRWNVAAGAFGNLDVIRPETFKPWLAAEWELAKFAQYFASTDALLAAALPWLFERGSAASVRRVLGWLGYDQVTIEEDGSYLHINLGRDASAGEMERIRHVVEASLPAHMRFYRLFFKLDQRPIRLDHGPALAWGLLDNDSGVPAAGIKASFGARHTAFAGPRMLLAIARGYTERRTVQLSYADRALLDAWALDSQILLDTYGGLSELYAGDVPRAHAPGAPERANGEGLIATVPWDGAEPQFCAQQHYTALLAAPVFPRRKWRGPWVGKWRPCIELKRSEET